MDFAGVLAATEEELKVLRGREAAAKTDAEAQAARVAKEQEAAAATAAEADRGAAEKKKAAEEEAARVAKEEAAAVAEADRVAAERCVFASPGPAPRQRSRRVPRCAWRCWQLSAEGFES